MKNKSQARQIEDALEVELAKQRAAIKKKHLKLKAKAIIQNEMIAKAKAEYKARPLKTKLKTKAKSLYREHVVKKQKKVRALSWL